MLKLEAFPKWTSTISSPLHDCFTCWSLTPRAYSKFYLTKFNRTSSIHKHNVGLPLALLLRFPHGTDEEVTVKLLGHGINSWQWKDIHVDVNTPLRFRNLHSIGQRRLNFNERLPIRLSGESAIHRISHGHGVSGANQLASKVQRVEIINQSSTIFGLKPSYCRNTSNKNRSRLVCGCNFQLPTNQLVIWRFFFMKRCPSAWASFKVSRAGGAAAASPRWTYPVDRFPPNPPGTWMLDERMRSWQFLPGTQAMENSFKRQGIPGKSHRLNGLTYE